MYGELIESKNSRNLDFENISWTKLVLSKLKILLTIDYTHFLRILTHQSKQFILKTQFCRIITSLVSLSITDHALFLIKITIRF